MTPARRAVLDRVAAAVLALPAERTARAGIDGVDGAGKTTFADELRDRPVPARDLRRRRGSRGGRAGGARGAGVDPALRRPLPAPARAAGDVGPLGLSARGVDPEPPAARRAAG